MGQPGTTQIGAMGAISLLMQAPSSPGLKEAIHPAELDALASILHGQQGPLDCRFVGIRMSG